VSKAIYLTGTLFLHFSSFVFWLLASLKRSKQDLVIYKRINLIFNVFRLKNKEKRKLENINTCQRLICIYAEHLVFRVRLKSYRNFENKTKQLLGNSDLGLHRNRDWNKRHYVTRVEGKIPCLSQAVSWEIVWYFYQRRKIDLFTVQWIRH
jgi:hypothetical protein